MPAVPYRDRPLRRIGLALAVAVGVHALVLGAGAVFFKDPLMQWVDRPASHSRQMQQNLEEAVADAPILESSFSMVGGLSSLHSENEIQSDGWDRGFEFALSDHWSWRADPALATAIRPPDVKRAR
jgi:hypothetical protein